MGARSAPGDAPAAADAAQLRYRAFLSYSHVDEAAVRLLHRRLERYRVPRALRRSSVGTVPARLHPVFRDRDELASATQLSASIERALDESRALVVVCSPAAARSPWVNAEIRWFRRHHPGRPVLAFVVAGDPGLDPRRDPEHAAFPPALALADPDQPQGELGEPLAADARPEADGFPSAFLKLVAGLLGVRFDELRRRDHRRRQRFWASVLAGALALAVVFAFLAWQASVARDAARAAQARAELELQSERQTREFLISVFRLADANEARGEQVTVREVLDRAVERIDRTEFNRPAIRSRFLATLGQAYTSLGLIRRGSELLRDSIDVLDGSELDAEVRHQRIDSRILLADALFEMGEYEAALATLAPVEQGQDAPDAVQRANAANVMGDVLTYQERDADAEAAYRRALALLQDAPGLDPALADDAHGRALLGLATLALFAGDAGSAFNQYQDATRLLERSLGEDHPATIGAIISLGSAAYRNGQRDAARDAWQRAMALAENVYDDHSPQIGTLKNNLGLLLLEDGDLATAEPLLRDALASDRRHRSEQFDDLAYPLHNLGYLLLLRGEHEEARALLQEGLGVARANRHRMLGPILNALADLDCSHGDAAAGLALAREAVDTLASAPEADAWRGAQARVTLASCRAAAGEPVEPAGFAAELDALRARWPAGSPFVQRAARQLQGVSR